MSNEIKNQTEKKVKETIQNNSEILFLYDAKMCNPNGDPDDENKPRMDYDRGINLVSDVRLKRYIRDYLMDYKDQTIFVSKINGAVVNPKTSLAKILGIDNKAKINVSSEQVQSFLNNALDVRFFGAILPDVVFEKGKGNVTFTGPIQFNWGYSLNKVTGPMESNGITSHFQSGKITDEQDSSKGSGAMGKDYRVNYSLIAFHGIISAKRAENTNLKDADIDLFDNAIVKAIPLEATTRSKTGQSPLLYIRVNYNTSEFFFGDMRKYVKIIDNNNIQIAFDDTAKLRSTADYKLDLSDLSAKLGKINDKIQEIYFWNDENIKINGWDIQDGNETKLKTKSKDGSNVVIPLIILPKQKKNNPN